MTQKPHETCEMAATRHLESAANMSCGVLSIDQHIQTATAYAMIGILRELENIRENGGEVVSQINTINAWLHGNVDGRPEVIVHKAEDMIAVAPMTDLEPW